MAADRNVSIERRGDETIIQIRSRFRVWRLIAIPPILAVSWMGMGLISLMMMATYLEWWGTVKPHWIEYFLFFAFGIIFHYLATMLLVVSFSKETLIINDRSLRYRFTLFGIGITHEYKLDEIGIKSVPESILGHNPIMRFFGLSRARFRICRGRKSKAICGDVDNSGASKVATIFQELPCFRIKPPAS